MSTFLQDQRTDSDRFAVVLGRNRIIFLALRSSMRYTNSYESRARIQATELFNAGNQFRS